MAQYRLSSFMLSFLINWCTLDSPSRCVNGFLDSFCAICFLRSRRISGIASFVYPCHKFVAKQFFRSGFSIKMPELNCVKQTEHLTSFQSRMSSLYRRNPHSNWRKQAFWGSATQLSISGVRILQKLIIKCFRELKMMTERSVPTRASLTFWLQEIFKIYRLPAQKCLSLLVVSYANQETFWVYP